MMCFAMKMKKGFLHTSCVQFVCIVIVKRDNVCTASAHIMPNQRPFRKRKKKGDCNMLFVSETLL